jgi:phosphatidylglycerol:prolipoprotein diacylglycerol transferase
MTLFPLIPYAKAPEIPIPFINHIPVLENYFDPRHPPSIKPFGTLVALGVYIGSVLAMRHARERGVSPQKMSDFIFWVLVGGFVGGHMLDAIFYHPAQLWADPVYLIRLWDGLSSYGGFVGAILGALAWRYRHKERILDMCEVITSVFPVAWVFGRSGCATVHDHPGIWTNAWYAVKWPVTNGAYVGRLDLGLIEMVLTIPLAATFLILWQRKPLRPLGFYTGWMCVAYAPVRFFLDFLRESESTQADPRYGGLTPAQWACFGLLLLGVYYVRRASLNPELPAGSVPAVVAESAVDQPAGESAGTHTAPDAAPPEPSVDNSSQAGS